MMNMAGCQLDPLLERPTDFARVSTLGLIDKPHHEDRTRPRRSNSRFWDCQSWRNNTRISAHWRDLESISNGVQENTILAIVPGQQNLEE